MAAVTDWCPTLEKASVNEETGGLDHKAKWWREAIANKWYVENGDLLVDISSSRNLDETLVKALKLYRMLLLSWRLDNLKMSHFMLASYTFRHVF